MNQGHNIITIKNNKVSLNVYGIETLNLKAMRSTKSHFSKIKISHNSDMINFTNLTPGIMKVTIYDINKLD